MLLTVKNNQRRLYQQIVFQFRGHRHFPVEISDVEAGHGRRVRWQLRARNATEAIHQRWEGANWIIELVSTGRRDGKPFHHIHRFITTLRTSPKALLRLVRRAGRSKTSGTGHATRSSVRMPIATASAMACRCWPCCGPWSLTCCAATVSDQSAQA